jgi:hypothetical protein
MLAAIFFPVLIGDEPHGVAHDVELMRLYAANLGRQVLIRVGD